MTLPDISLVTACLKRRRFSLSREKQTQQEIEAAFEQDGIAARREVNLGAGDIPDFMVDGLAIEVKLRSSSKMEIWRQIKRYARHEEVEAILLVTNRAMGLPPEIEGKPAYYLSLGAAWM